MSATRLVVPEVVQTSAMDCGPAALKSLLDGFRIDASYDRLREACQTDVDGTSIDDLETTARALGLDAKQVMLPSDHLFLASARALPGLCVVRLPSGLTHFVVLWRRHGSFVQVMDPATGRRLTPIRIFREELYHHTQSVPAFAWRAWAGGDEFTSALVERGQALAVDRGVHDRLTHTALADDTWAALGALDAALRMTAALVEAKGIRRGTEATRLFEQLTIHPHRVPDRYWSVRPSSTDRSQLRFRGIVLIRVRGRSTNPPAKHTLPVELRAALDEDAPTPARDLIRMLWSDGAFGPSVLATGVVVAAGTVAIEGLLWRTLLELGRDLTTTGQRVGALAVAGAFLALMLLLQWPIAALTLRLSRTLEGRFRTAFLRRIPRLSDRYFHSRLVSDMAERSHAVHQLRQLPDVAVKFARATLGMGATVVGVWWLYPQSGWLATLAAIVAVATPLFAQSYLAEQDMRVRNRLGALSRFYFDALRGGIMLRAHGAERAMQREHGALLGEWARAGISQQATIAAVEAGQLALTLGISAWLVMRYLSCTRDLPGLLLLAYWTLDLSTLGESAANAAWQYPRLRNVMRRLTEPLNAPDDTAAGSPRAERPPSARGIAIRMSNVSARANGHTILANIDIAIPAAQHVAIVGESGAGKSTLVGLLLGWLRPASGEITIDGRPLVGSSLQELRDCTAWIDPTVQLWNRSLFDNLVYGLRADPPADIGQVLDDAQLHECIRHLPDGLRTSVGEDGALLSGGEGQRARIGRGLLHKDARLVILDEPARGLDRHRRTEIVATCRSRWPDATMLCVTHDVADTVAFDRVLVVHRGAIVEDGPPSALIGMADSRYSRMLTGDRGAARLWSGGAWRRLVARRGAVDEVAF